MSGGDTGSQCESKKDKDGEDDEEAVNAQRRLSADPLPIRHDEAVRWQGATREDMKLIIEGFRRRQRQRQEDDSGLELDHPDLNLIIEGIRLRQRQRQEDDCGRGDLMKKSGSSWVRLPFATHLAQGLISTRELAALAAADDADDGWRAVRRGRCRRRAVSV